MRAGLRNPVRITVKEKGVAATSVQKTPARLSNYYMVSRMTRMIFSLKAVCNNLNISSCLLWQLCRTEDKFNTLVAFLRQHKHEKQLVFFRYKPTNLSDSFHILSSFQFLQSVYFLRLYLFHSTCACVEYFGRALEVFVKNVPILCIHGKMKDKRNKIFSEFRELKR